MDPYSTWLRMKLSSPWLPRFSEKSIASRVSFNQERNVRQDRAMKQKAKFEVLQKVSLMGPGNKDCNEAPAFRGPTSCHKPMATNSKMQESGGWHRWVKHTWEGRSVTNWRGHTPSEGRHCPAVQPAAAQGECRSQGARAYGSQ